MGIMGVTDHTSFWVSVHTTLSNLSFTSRFDLFVPFLSALRKKANAWNNSFLSFIFTRLSNID